MSRTNRLTDNVYSISDDALHRLAYKAGANRVNGLVYPEMRKIIMSYLNNLIKFTVEYASYEKKKTISEDHVKMAIEFLGSKSYFAFNFKTKPCHVSTKKKIVSRINEYQNQSDCLTFPKLSISRLIREVGQDYQTNLKWSENSLVYIQNQLEDVLIRVLTVAIKILINSKRTTLDRESVKLAVNILTDACQGQNYHLTF